jgi:enoyl-CoA hydratase/carnithine racemase
MNCSYEVKEGGIALATIDNPPMNALSSKTVADITLTIRAALEDPKVRVIVLTGKGKAFVAGADISEIKTLATKEDARALAQRGCEMTNTIERANKPVIAAINGFCLGGGLELAMSCHMRIASEKALLGLPEINLGIIPGFAGTQRLPRIVGKAKGLEMILSGAHYSAQDALAMGLVNKVVAPESVVDEAISLARTIAAKGRLAVIAAIDSASKGLGVSFDAGCEIESNNFAGVAISSDAKEGLDAFLSKRKPEFKDK